jgi:NAD(P)-dependent dehydrogenase (short-subunit alcohol dehydrogenase family)
VSGPRMAAEGWYSVSRRQLLADRRLAVFLTGGGSGIGAAIFGELATTVGCVSCHRTVAFKAEHVAPIAMDVPDHAAGRRAFTSFAEFVWPAGLVNNAGAHHSKPNIELDLAYVRDSLEPNRTEPNRTEPNRTGSLSYALHSWPARLDRIHRIRRLTKMIRYTRRFPAAFRCERIGTAGRGRPPGWPRVLKVGCEFLAGQSITIDGGQGVRE